MATIGAFIEKVAKGGAFEKKFDKDPEGTMTDFGLTPAQIKSILNDSVVTIKDQAEKDLKKNVLVFRVKMG